MKRLRLNDNQQAWLLVAGLVAATLLASYLAALIAPGP